MTLPMKRVVTPQFVWIVMILGVGFDVGAQTRIMPLGDSITSAEAGHASYRYWLWKDLEAAGFHVDFVGTQRGVEGGAPRFLEFDQDHEGHWGWRAEEVLAEVHDWAVVTRPDIVLLHLGHNDLYARQGVDGTIDELAAIIGELRRYDSSIAVLMAMIIPGSSPELEPIESLNAAVRSLAGSLTTAQSRVVVVDQWTGFDPTLDTYDGVHPNETGEKKISRRWLAALIANPDILERAGPPQPRRAGHRLQPPVGSPGDRW